MTSSGRRFTLPFSVAVLVLALAAPAASQQQLEAVTGGAAGKPEADHTMFDVLRPEADIIYLLASSSVVFGPDPNGRSEEITFVGFVTVPKWPMPGYERRVMEPGRHQIDIELTESELSGESYLLGEAVQLGEHPDLKSLGTITEPSPPGPLPAVGRQTATQAVRQERATTSYVLTENLDGLMERNPNILWSEIIAAQLRDLIENRAQEIRAGEVRPNITPPPTAPLIEKRIELPPDLIERMNEFPRVEWGPWIYEIAENVAADLLEREIITVGEDVRFNPALIPNDFVVARKVLLTTAKGILYNETPVPVRGTLDSIPPVKEPDTPLGINVFRGMELPIPLLAEDGEINGWFYSKAHMAYAVVPDAIQRDHMQAVVDLEDDTGHKEAVTLEGPVEIHHRSGADGVEMEVIVLALRGQSEILGGDVMFIEAFSDRDRFSRGVVAAAGAEPAPMDMDLFVQVFTPSDKLANEDPIRLSGSVQGIEQVGRLAKGQLDIPRLSGRGSFATPSATELFDEAGRSVARIVGLQFELGEE